MQEHKDVFELFKDASKRLAEELDGLFPSIGLHASAKAEAKAPTRQVKTLKDRIEEAERDPTPSYAGDGSH